MHLKLCAQFNFGLAMMTFFKNCFIFIFHLITPQTFIGKEALFDVKEGFGKEYC